jgi:hypothetical protein
VWRPTSIEQLERAVLDGVLEEKHDFDAKRQLPTSGSELAKDIAAMTTDGGILVYGIAEDQDRRPRALAPIELAGRTAVVFVVSRLGPRPPVRRVFAQRAWAPKVAAPDGA